MMATLVAGAEFSSDATWSATHINVLSLATPNAEKLTHTIFTTPSLSVVTLVTQQACCEGTSEVPKAKATGVSENTGKREQAKALAAAHDC